MRVVPVSLESIRACVFDAYGTLFDVRSATAHAREELGGALEAIQVLWRERQLQYTWLRAVQGLHADFWQVTGDALDFALDTHGFRDPALRERLLQGYLELEVFADVAATLGLLREAGLRTAVLSNGSPRMLEAALEHAHIAALIDAVLSVESVGVYKPHHSVYQLAVDRLEVPKQAIAFVSSNAWDAHAATVFGLRTVWCNRQGHKLERLPGRPEHEIRSLAELPALL